MEYEYIRPAFNSRYPEPSEEIQYKLYLSWMEAQKTEHRDMYCPVCGFKVAVIPKNQTTVQNVFCRKCKFTGPLSPAYFRRLKRGVRGQQVHQRHRTFIR